MQSEPSTQTIGTETPSSGKSNVNENQIDLVALFAHMIKKAHWIALGALAGAAIAAILVSFVISPVYSTTAKLYIVNSETSISLADIQIGSNLAGDYQEVFKNWHIHELVIQRLGTDLSYKKLSKMVSVSNPSNTHVLYITVKSGDPSEARLIANTYAEVASEFIAVKMDMRQPITKVIPVTTAEYGILKASRPKNSRLDKSKLIESGFKPLPDWKDAVRRYLGEAGL